MDLNRVRHAFWNFNYGDMYNRACSCEPISVKAAQALVNGMTPQPGSGLIFDESPGFSARRYGRDQVLYLRPERYASGQQAFPGTVPDGQTRAQLVWSWLEIQTPASVFVFAQDSDHCYNFVVYGGIYLIDASTQTYRKINTPGDASSYSPKGITKEEKSPYHPGFPTGSQGKNYPQSTTDLGFNYLSPQPRHGKDGLAVYYWGELHPNWR